MIRILSTIFALFIGPKYIHAAEILEKYSDTAVLVKYDEFSENFEVGDRFFVMVEDKKRGLIKVKALGKRNVLLADLIKGIAPVGSPVKLIPKPPTPPPPAAIVAPPETSNVSGLILIASNFFFRGLNTTGGHVRVLGAMNYDFKIGLNAGAFISNTGTTATETDFYASYTLGNDMFAATVQYWRYAFPGTIFIDTDDYQLKFKVWKFYLLNSYIPNYFAAGSAAYYSELGVSLPLSKKVLFNSSIGLEHFDKYLLIGFQDYANWKLSFTYLGDWANLELMWTDTNRRDPSGVRLIDTSTSVMLSKGF